MDTQEFMDQFFSEARRLRLNMYRLPALAMSASDGQARLLDRMRELKVGATWEDVFPGMELPDVDPELEEAIAELDADPERYWRERDFWELLFAELDRIVPGRKAEAGGNSIGFNVPDRDRALRMLQRLPDGAGWDAFLKALEA